jgi:hypothetical protein
VKATIVDPKAPSPAPATPAKPTPVAAAPTPQEAPADSAPEDDAEADKGLPAWAKYRVAAATEHAEYFVVGRSKGNGTGLGGADIAYEVHAVRKGRYVHTVVALRPNGSVHVVTESLLPSEIVRIEIQGDHAGLEVVHHGTRKVIQAPLALVMALSKTR